MTVKVFGPTYTGGAERAVGVTVDGLQDRLPGPQVAEIAGP